MPEERPNVVARPAGSRAVAAPSDVTLAVLAGGRGSRMGATKDRLLIAGRPALIHLLDRLDHPGPTLLVTAINHPTPVGHERFDRVVFDPVVGAGPLAGLAAAVAATATELVVVLSVDMPNVGPEQVAWLRGELTARPGCHGLLCERGEGGGESGDSGAAGIDQDAPRRRVEPFPAGFRAAAGPALSAELAAGRRALHTLLDLPGFAVAAVPSTWPGSVWLNLNRPDDLQPINASIL